jgi:hypothetical protein
MARPLPGRVSTDLVGIGAVAQPTSGLVEITNVYKSDVFPGAQVIRLDFKLTKARVAITDGTTSGSYGSLKLFDFAEGAISFLGSRQDYTAYASDGTGVPNDTAFAIGLGTAAIAAAADGTLGTGTSQDIGKSIAQTLSSGTTTGTAVTAAVAAGNGTATPIDLNLNVSGSAATVDGDGWLDVTATISVLLMFMGDD